MASPNTLRRRDDELRLRRSTMGDYVFIAAAMVPNPLAVGPRFVRPPDGLGGMLKGDTYRCREGQVRGKSELKRLRKARRQPWPSTATDA